MGTRRKFSSQFKAEAVQFVIESGRSVAQVPRGLQINEGTLGNWVQAWRSQHPEPEPALSPVERQRVSASAARRAALAVAVRGVFEEFRQVYGCRQIA